MRELVALSNGTIGFRDDQRRPTSSKGLPVDLDSQIIKRRKADTYEVRWYTIAGGDQIPETHAWPGTIIPIVCAMGDEVVVDGKRLFQGVIAQGKSSQAMFNYGMTNQAIPWLSRRVRRGLRLSARSRGWKRSGTRRTTETIASCRITPSTLMARCWAHRSGNRPRRPIADG